MNSFRKALRPWTGNGIPYYENGVIVGELVIYVEWTNPAKSIYDDQQTCWKEVKMGDIPNIILDSEGEIVE